MQLRTEVEIEAPSSIVWDILVDRSKYHEWNPFITTFEGPLEKGAALEIVVSPPDSSDFRFRPRLVEVEPHKELRWRGSLIAEFLLSGEHYITLTALEDQRTRVCHGEDFQGLLLRFMAGHLGKTQRGFVFMNQALKRRAETIFAATGSPMP